MGTEGIYLAIATTLAISRVFPSKKRVSPSMSLFICAHDRTESCKWRDTPSKMVAESEDSLIVFMSTKVL